MMKAIEKVHQTGAPIRATAREFGLPEASLRHKLSGRVDPESTRSGPPPIFSLEEECHLVDHIKFMSQCGYRYSRSEVVDIASEYAVSLCKRDSQHPLSLTWYHSFMSRWPELKLMKPFGLELHRAKTRYYQELGSILDKYSLKDRPGRIYNIDEKGLYTSPSPLAIAVTSGSRLLVTVIRCGNALGQSVPPFFVFPGARMKPELLEGATPGTDGTVTETGWSNSVVFRRYIEQHLLKYLPKRSPDNPVLVLYDGHMSHINLGLIDWAKNEHIILFTLPAHTSHVLHPLDIGSFGPFEKIYNSVSHKFMRKNISHRITRYDVCSLGCVAYSKALTASNLQSFFSKNGIYPYNSDVLDSSDFKPSEILQEDKHTETKDGLASVNSSFFSEKSAKTNQKKAMTRKRQYLRNVVSGKAITEDSTVDRVKEHEESKKKAKV